MIVPRINQEEMPNQREREMHPDSHTSEELFESISNQPEKQQWGPETDEKTPRGIPDAKTAP